MGILVINLETGRPTVEAATQHMSQALRSAKSQRLSAVKLIHGYGSSGVGGKIRAEVHRQLASMQRAGKIKAYIKGEEFSPFEESARKALDSCPQLSRDSDFSRQNHGITVVVL